MRWSWIGACLLVGAVSATGMAAGQPQREIDPTAPAGAQAWRVPSPGNAGGQEMDPDDVVECLRRLVSTDYNSMAGVPRVCESHCTDLKSGHTAYYKVDIYRIALPAGYVLAVDVDKYGAYGLFEPRGTEPRLGKEMHKYYISEGYSQKADDCERGGVLP